MWGLCQRELYLIFVFLPVSFRNTRVTWLPGRCGPVCHFLHLTATFHPRLKPLLSVRSTWAEALTSPYNKISSFRACLIGCKIVRLGKWSGPTVKYYQMCLVDQIEKNYEKSNYEVSSYQSLSFWLSAFSARYELKIG